MKDLNSIFSFALDFYNNKKNRHVSEAWLYTVTAYLKKAGFTVVKTSEVDKIPNPYRDALKKKGL